MRHTGPKNRLARAEGIDLGLKTAGSKSHSSLIKRLNIVPGQHGTKRRREMTEYGVQLREKQKLRRIYGVTERQMKNYFKRATQAVGNTAETLVRLLESRLDNVVYRLGFTPTRAAARQLVNHGHMAVGGRKVSIPSYSVSEGEVIEFRRDLSTKIPHIARMLEKKDVIVPEWLARTGPVGKVKSGPSKAALSDDVNAQMVVEFYSR